MASTFEKLRNAVLQGVVPPSPPETVSAVIAKNTPPRVQFVRPEYVYLGHVEFAELMLDPSAQGHVGLCEDRTYEFCGVSIIRVRVENHFAVGWQPST